MKNGLYVATSGLLMQDARVVAISNNLANANTVGFKRDLTVFSEYKNIDRRIPQNWIQKTSYNKAINAAVKLDENTNNQSVGPLKSTGNTFDLALEGENSFFAIDTPWGLRFTRNGEFTLNDMGELVNQDGFNVLDANGANITIPNNTEKPTITKSGNIYIGDVQISQIDVAYFSEPEKLQKVGRNLYAAIGVLPEEPSQEVVRQGYVELSNVSPVLEMVRMIDAMRGFEMYQKMVQTYDGLNDKTANEIARA
jgi:flagellar basal-body rod protein FlgG